MKTYLKIFLDINEKRKEDLPDRSLILRKFINELDYQNLHSFVRDVLVEDELCMNTIFSNSLFVSANEQSFDWLMDLPHNTLDKFQRIFEDLYKKSLFSDQNEDLFIQKKIKAIVALNKHGLTKNFLINTFSSIDATKLKGKIERLEILKLLSFIEKDENGDGFIDSLFVANQINFSKEPYLSPAFLNLYKGVNYSSFKAFRILREVDRSPRKPESAFDDDFVSFLRSFLNNFFKVDYKQRAVEFIRFINNLESKWLKSYLDEAMNLPKFDPVKEEIEQILGETKTRERFSYAHMVVADKLAYFYNHYPESFYEIENTGFNALVVQYSDAEDNKFNEYLVQNHALYIDTDFWEIHKIGFFEEEKKNNSPVLLISEDQVQEIFKREIQGKSDNKWIKSIDQTINSLIN